MSADRPDVTNAIQILFGPFELSIAERTLRKAGEPVPLGARAFDILVVLVERPGQTVSKSDLIGAVWPDVTVEGGNLRVHVSALRKALGDGQFGSKYIANVQGRGYSFVAPVVWQAPSAAWAATLNAPSTLPTMPSEMVGRDDIALQIRARLRNERLVTIVGAGGIGKTTLSLAVGRAVSGDFAGAVVFVDLSVLTSRHQIVAGIASAMGFALPPSDTEAALLEFLRPRRALVILDNCEHLIEHIAEIADRIGRQAPDIRLLPTSRESLQTAGEYVYRLEPLHCPPKRGGQTIEEILSYPAARLFIDRVDAHGGGFTVDVDNARLVAEICRRLDGIPLAIELVARRAVTFGVRDTAARLASVDLLKLGQRSTSPRHQTLRATLDWSHELLSDVERVVLRRVSVFIGSFTLEAALAVAELEEVSEYEVADAIGSLVEKSLILSRIESREASYRLLDTTRNYALDRLTASGERGLIASRHALYFAQMLEASGDEFFDAAASHDEWLVKTCLGNVRAGLDWSFGPDGGDELAVRLAAAAGALLLALSLLTECRDWLTKAVDRLDGAGRDAGREMIIQSALASCMMFTDGMTDQSYAAWERSRLLARDLENAAHELFCLLVLWAHQVRIPDYEQATWLADCYGELAEQSGAAGAIATANYMRGVTRHHSGQLIEAEAYLERAIDQDDEPSRQALLRRFGYDRTLDAMSVLANLKWLRGRPDHALRLNRIAIAEARQLDHAVPLCVALTWACFNRYLTNRADEGTLALVDELVEVAGSHNVLSYHGFGLAMRGLCAARQGDLEVGRDLLRTGIGKLSASSYGVFNAFLEAEFAHCLAAAGRAHEGVDLFEGADIHLDWPAWYGPELSRIRGELAMKTGDRLAAQEHFVYALDQAARQGALSWTLRAATSLALAESLSADRVATDGTLRAIHAQFREGRDTQDVRMAAETIYGARQHAQAIGTDHA